MAQVTCLNNYTVYCDCAACEALEETFQDRAAAEAQADPYYRFNLGLEETNAQRALRLKADAELDELYGAQADAFYAALMDHESMVESMVETGADDR